MATSVNDAVVPSGDTALLSASVLQSENLENNVMMYKKGTYKINDLGRGIVERDGCKNV